MNRQPISAILHFAPVLLALFCLALSLTSYSVYEGFSEGEPATWLSLTLMTACLLLVVQALRSRSTDPMRRRLAMILAPILGLAMLDERFKGHEAVGEFVQDHAVFLPKEVRHYTDDVLIILGAILGGLLLFATIRRLPGWRNYRPYVFWVFTAALTHGVCDMLGHGRYLWRAVLPALSRSEVHWLTEVFSYFEESSKLWAEWFVLLLLLRLFYDRRGGLFWSVQVFLGAALAVSGLWVVEDPTLGIPYLYLGGSLRYLRNYHLIAWLTVIWLLWAGIVWRFLGHDARRRAAGGMFFLTPWYVLLPQIAAFPNAAALHPLGMVFTVGGILLPAAAWLILRRRRPHPAWSLALLGGLVWVGSPLAWLVALGAAVVLVLRRLEFGGEPNVRAWAGLIGLQAVAIACALSLSFPALMPNKTFKPRDGTPFEVGRQRVR